MGSIAIEWSTPIDALTTIPTRCEPPAEAASGTDSATIEYKVESSRVIWTIMSGASPPMRRAIVPPTPIESGSGTPGSVIAITIADSHAFNATSRSTPAAPVLVSSVTAKSTPAMRASIRTTARMAAASANPRRLGRACVKRKDRGSPNCGSLLWSISDGYRNCRRIGDPSGERCAVR